MSNQTQQLSTFYVDNRKDYPQRWMLTLDEKEPRGYSHVVRWQDARHRIVIYVWGETLDVNYAQIAVLRYWKAVFNANPFSD